MTKREKLFPSFLNDTKHVSFPMIQEMNKKFFQTIMQRLFYNKNKFPVPRYIYKDIFILIGGI